MGYVGAFLILCVAASLVLALGEGEERQKTLQRTLRSAAGLVGGIGFLALVVLLLSR